MCAYQTGDSGTDLSKLEVAPCFLPKYFAGPYWIVAYNETEGYALISGGQPTIVTDDGCKSGDGTNNSGLWIFTRSQERDTELVAKVRTIASEAGFDLSVLNDVSAEIKVRGNLQVHFEHRHRRNQGLCKSASPF